MVPLIFKSSTKTQTASQEQLPVQHTNRQQTPVTITNPSYLSTCQQVSQAFSPHFLLQPQDQRYHKESTTCKHPERLPRMHLASSSSSLTTRAPRRRRRRCLTYFLLPASSRLFSLNHWLCCAKMP